MLMKTRERDAPVDRRNRARRARSCEVREADGDDQEGFEPFTEGDDKRLQHG